MDPSPEPAAPRIRIHRFPDWRALHTHLAEEARRDPERLLILTGTDGARAALEDAIRRRLLAGREAAVQLPAVRTPALAIADLLQRADPPGTLATPLARSLMMENALLDAADAEGAPAGNPLRLSGPLLRLLDEQARDRVADPERPAFETLLARASRTFGENEGLDEGAARLLRLTAWLERVHRNYRDQLDASDTLDLDLARRRLLASPPAAPWSEIRVVGDQAGGVSDHQLFGALAPPGNLHFLLLTGDPSPALPRGWTAEEETVEAPAAAPPRLFTPAGAEAATSEPFLFRRTDRGEEARAAVELLRTHHRTSGLAFGGFERCAVAARNPAAYLDALAARLTEAGIPFQTRLQPSLAEEPWPAGLDDALAFAERPGRLSLGIALLRSPFFQDDRLPRAPGPLADIAEASLADAGIANTHEPEDLDDLAATVGRIAEDRLAEVPADAESPERARNERAARELRQTAAVVERLAAYARALAPIRDGRTPFREAVRCFAEFATARFSEPPDDAALRALAQAADPALPETPVGDAARFRDRVRRQLRRQTTNRHPGRTGVHLIAAEDAPFGDYDCLILLGVGDADWPGPRPGNVFFPTRVLERATRARSGDARRREARLLGSFATLAGQSAGFVRAELEDGFPAGASPLFAALGERLRRNPNEPLPVEVPEAAGSGGAPLPRGLERRAPGAVDLAARPLSPSALVLYARNPAQFFLQRVLRLREERPLTDTGSRTARGARLHALMEEAAPAFCEEHGPVCEANLDAALAFFRERYRALEDPGLTPEVREAEELWLFGGDSHPAALVWFLREEADRGPGAPVQIEETLEGTVEPASGDLPALRVRGVVDRVDALPDGRRRVLEYKSGSSAGRDDAFLQARLYARLAGADAPAEAAVPFFRDRVWGVPDKPEELDARIRAVRDGLAEGAFPVPADPKEIKPFDWPLAIRPDLPEGLAQSASARPQSASPPPAPVLSESRRPAAFHRPADHADREAAADPARHVVLRASAGTGKTTVLTRRYRNLVRAGVPPRNILALTFTRKAAAEMKGRILQGLQGAEIHDNPDLAEVAVSTLDAFNLGLIREFPLDAGVAPGVEVLDEREMPVVQQEAIERVLTGATGFARRTLAELPLLGKSLARLDELAKTYLDNRLTWRATFASEAERLAGRPPAPRPALRDGLLPAESGVRRFLAGCGGPVPLPVRLALRLAEQPGSSDALDRESLVAWFRPDLKTYPKGAKEMLAEVLPEYRQLKEALRDFNGAWLDSLNGRTFAPLWALLRAVEAEYDALKQDRGVMDFDDLTLAATRLLKNTGEFAESRFRLEARYHHLLLDEFQDTSDPQWDLLRAIAKPWTEGEGLAAGEVRRVTRGRLREPTLFVVGDHKQSIYRFRNARVELVRRTAAWIRSRFAARPDPGISLRWNFRSTAPLRAFVNDVAAAMAEADETQADWRFGYGEKDRLQEDPDPGGVSENAPLAVAVAEDHEEAARRVAARIAALADAGTPLDEIAILSRAATRLPAYREAVERLGHPTYLVRDAGLFETSEVRDLTALARFLARPSSDLRAVELLRSRFFAFPARTLAALRNADRGAETPFSDRLRGAGGTPPDLPAEDAAAWAEAGRQGSRWIGLSRRLPPSLAVRRILAETDYLERARADNASDPFAGRQQVANLERALDLLRRVERDGFATFQAAAHHLEAAASGGHDATQAPLRAAGAVQVLTIHAAKGLEYEHVFLVDLNGRTRGAGGGLRVQEGDDGRWSIALISDSRDWEIRDGGRSAAEERRCLYVGMTRAKRGLTLAATTKFTTRGAPYKPQGLARFLPGDLWNAVAQTAREPAGEVREIAWKRHRLAVLPSPDSR